MTATSELDRRQGRLAGKVAIVVGGGSTGETAGTGSAIAVLFAAQGAKVVVVGRSESNTSKTVAQIEAAGDEAVGVLGDATVDADCRRFAQSAVERFGHLDIVVNNLGTGAGPTVAAFDELAWDESMAVNLKSVLLMTKHALPHLVARETASIVNVGSVAGLQASGSIAYGTAKGGLIALTREMAGQLGPDGIRVNCVIPGHLATPMGARGGPGLGELRRKLSMVGIEGTGWDAAWAALFFASDESQYVTAAALPVDGGVTAQLTFSTYLRVRSGES